MSTRSRGSGSWLLASMVILSLCRGTVQIAKNFVNYSTPDLRPTFVVNFDTSTVICQHSSDPTDLHIHNMSSLCDGKQDCFVNPAMHDEVFPYCEHKCQSTCSGKGACLYDGSKPQCYCDSGFSGAACELQDKNECLEHPCHLMAQCQNTLGSYECRCLPGYQGNGHECSDIDECAEKIGSRCPEHSQCINLPGTYYCNCTQGFSPKGNQGSGLDKCVDINECETGAHNCEKNEICENTIGSFKCVTKCSPGYELINGKCEDVNECGSEKLHKCDVRAECINTVGGYECECEEGFDGDGKNCQPKSSCRKNSGICDRHASCHVVLDICDCKTGYTGDGITCHDINECDAKETPCSAGGRCLNLDGGYVCCKDGQDDQACIKDQGAFCSGGCGDNAICSNSTCECIGGFQGDPKKKCVDINECVENDSICGGVGDRCVNLFGGYKCCQHGSKDPECSADQAFSSDSSTISSHGADFTTTGEQIIEGSGSIQTSSGGSITVTRGLIPKDVELTTSGKLACTSYCPANSECRDGFCECIQGYGGNALVGCEDIDECITETCDEEANEWCVNLIGGFVCCNPTNATHDDCLGLEITREKGLHVIGGNEEDTIIAARSNHSTSDQLITQVVQQSRNFSSGQIILTRGKVPNGEAVTQTTDADEFGLEISAADLAGSGSGVGILLTTVEPMKIEGSGVTTQKVDSGVWTEEEDGEDDDLMEEGSGSWSTNVNGTGFTGSPRSEGTIRVRITTLGEDGETETATKAGVSVPGRSGANREEKEGSGVAGESGSSGSSTTSSEGSASGSEASGSSGSSTTSSGEGSGASKPSEGSSGSSGSTTTSSEGSATSTGEGSGASGSSGSSTTSSESSASGSTESGSSGSSGSSTSSSKGSATNGEGSAISSGSSGSSTTSSEGSASGSTESGSSGSSGSSATSSEGSASSGEGSGASKPSEESATSSGEGSGSSTTSSEGSASGSTESGSSGSAGSSTTSSEGSASGSTESGSSGSSTVTGEGSGAPGKPSKTEDNLAVKKDGEESASSGATATATSTSTSNGKSTSSEPSVEGSGASGLPEGSGDGNGEWFETGSKGHFESGSKVTVTSGKGPKPSEAPESQGAIGTKEPSGSAKPKPSGSQEPSEPKGPSPNGPEITTDGEDSSSSTSGGEKGPKGDSGDKPTTDDKDLPLKGDKKTDKEVEGSGSPGPQEGSGEPTGPEEGSGILTTSSGGSNATLEHGTKLERVPGTSGTKGASEKDSSESIGLEISTGKKPQDGSNEVGLEIVWETTTSGPDSDKVGLEISGIDLTTTTKHPVEGSGTGDEEITATTRDISKTKSTKRPRIEVDGGENGETSEVDTKPTSATEAPTSPGTTAQTLEVTPEGGSGEVPEAPEGSGTTDATTDAPEVSPTSSAPAPETSPLPTEASKTSKAPESLESTTTTSAKPSEAPKATTEASKTPESATITVPNQHREEPRGTKDTFALPTTTTTPAPVETIENTKCTSSDECGMDALCERRTGVCRCEPGFEGAPPKKECVDVDECATGDHKCHESARCQNFIGGYACFCPTGFRKTDDGSCEDIDECTEHNSTCCGANAHCVNKPGTYSCECENGYLGDGYHCVKNTKKPCDKEQILKMHCSESNMSCEVDTFNGAVECKECMSGYKKEGTSCEDINECEASGTCSPNANCQNLNGTFSCSCKPGFRGDGFMCTDINECDEKHPCHPHAECTNLEGSFSCQCHSGFEGDGVKKCTNPLERSCEDVEKFCGRVNHVSCLSVRIYNGSLSSVCECEPGFRFDKVKNECVDIDECEENRNNCDPASAVCVNTEGSFRCECAEGYEGEGGVCTDIDECDRGMAGCDSMAMCINRMGSCGCKCMAGYTGDGAHCTKISEPKSDKTTCTDEWSRLCELEKKQCTVDEEEVPQCGACLPGHHPINGTCQSLQISGLCAQKNDCNKHAECIDILPDSHFCSCPDGFIGDGMMCDDVDECTNAGMCEEDANSQCENTIGSFKCVCTQGYHKDGDKCVPEKQPQPNRGKVEVDGEESESTNSGDKKPLKEATTQGTVSSGPETSTTSSVTSSEVTKAPEASTKSSESPVTSSSSSEASKAPESTTVPSTLSSTLSSKTPESTTSSSGPSGSTKPSEGSVTSSKSTSSVTSPSVTSSEYTKVTTESSETSKATSVPPVTSSGTTKSPVTSSEPTTKAPEATTTTLSLGDLVATSSLKPLEESTETSKGSPEPSTPSTEDPLTVSVRIHELTEVPESTTKSSGSSLQPLESTTTSSESSKPSEVPAGLATSPIPKTTESGKSSEATKALESTTTLPVTSSEASEASTKLSKSTTVSPVTSSEGTVKTTSESPTSKVPVTSTESSEAPAPESTTKQSRASEATTVSVVTSSKFSEITKSLVTSSGTSEPSTKASEATTTSSVSSVTSTEVSPSSVKTSDVTKPPVTLSKSSESVTKASTSSSGSVTSPVTSSPSTEASTKTSKAPVTSSSSAASQAPESTTVPSTLSSTSSSKSPEPTTTSSGSSGPTKPSEGSVTSSKSTSSVTSPSVTKASEATTTSSVSSVTSPELSSSPVTSPEPPGGSTKAPEVSTSTEATTTSSVSSATSPEPTTTSFVKSSEATKSSVPVSTSPESSTSGPSETSTSPVTSSSGTTKSSVKSSEPTTKAPETTTTSNVPSVTSSEVPTLPVTVSKSPEPTTKPSEATTTSSVPSVTSSEPSESTTTSSVTSPESSATSSFKSEVTKSPETTRVRLITGTPDDVVTVTVPSRGSRQNVTNSESPSPPSTTTTVPLPSTTSGHRGPPSIQPPASFTSSTTETPTNNGGYGEEVNQEEETSTTSTTTSEAPSLCQNITCHSLATCEPSSGTCICRDGFIGDGLSSCSKKSTADCISLPSLCAENAKCDNATRSCECSAGYIGDGYVCSPHPQDCVLRKDLCSPEAICQGRRCQCLPGFTGDGVKCVSIHERASNCSQCDENAQCVGGTTCKCNPGYFGNGLCCVPDPLDCVHFTGICHPNAACNQKTRQCECTSGFSGNGVSCFPQKSCRTDASVCAKNAICLPTGNCICRHGFKGDPFYKCSSLVSKDPPSHQDLSDVTSCHTPCSSSQLCISGECICKSGFRSNSTTSETCEDIDECAEKSHKCDRVAKCENTFGSHICTCPDGFVGDGTTCVPHVNHGKLSVYCEADGMTLVLGNETSDFEGKIFVKGQAENPHCSKTFSPLLNSHKPYVFKVAFQHCDVQLLENHTMASTVVVQKHAMFLTNKADSYDLRCQYPIGSRAVESHVNVSELATTSTLTDKNSTLAPICRLSVSNDQQLSISSATVGDTLKLALEVTPNDNFGILPRNCFAVNIESGERYTLTDDMGCAIDESLFPQWSVATSYKVQAVFRTFKWPDSSMIRFQCDCAPCVGQCSTPSCISTARFRRHHTSTPIVSEEVRQELILMSGVESLAVSSIINVHDSSESSMDSMEPEDVKTSPSSSICVKLAPLLIALSSFFVCSAILLYLCSKKPKTVDSELSF